MTDPLLVEQDGAIRWLKLNRPDQRNALSPDLIAALDGEIDAAAADEGTSVVVIAGEGRSFCAGADLAHLLELAKGGETPLNFLGDVSACFTHIERMPKPVVAAVHGHAVAGGLELALACDVVVAQSGALLGDGHAKNGLIPGGGASLRLPRKAGEPFARWLMLTGALEDAEKFVPIGLVHMIAAPEEFEQTVTDVANRLAKTESAVHARIKQVLDGWADTSADEQLARELSVFEQHWHHFDVAEKLIRFFGYDPGE